MNLTLAQITEATGAELVGESDRTKPYTTGVWATGWSIDSRTVVPGDLFIALKGEHVNGHQYLDAAFAKGAVACLVSEVPAQASGLLLKVRNSLTALAQLAHSARRSWGKQIVAVTGSAGKTSTKDIIASLLTSSFTVGKTIGNFNNHIGLPLSILRLPEQAEVAVLEMGMNHGGEIRHLARIAEPQRGVVTNVGYAHVEAFDSVAGIAAAKRELVEELPPPGVAILNADDEWVRQFRSAHKGRTISYGFSEDADVRASEPITTSTGTAFTVDDVRFTTVLQGRHSLSNILAGIAVARSFDIPPAQLVPAVAELHPGSMRGERHVRNGITILNDSYNSNPEAVRSMLAVLRDEPAERRIAVLGEMLELGTMSPELHRNVGRWAVDAQVDILVGVAGCSSEMIAAAQAAGLSKEHARFFDDPVSAGAYLKGMTRAGDALLFKGSRGTHVERALAALES